MAHHDVKILSFNVRGLNNRTKRVALFKYVKRNECDILFLQESYSCIDDEAMWLQEWEGKGVFAHGTKHSKGIAILFKKHLDYDIITTKIDTKGRFILLKIKIKDIEFVLINIYAPNRENERLLFLN